MEAIIALCALALLARIGLALYTTGLCRAKNAAAAALRAVCDLCFVVLAFWAVGAAILAQRANPVLAVNVRFLLGWDFPPDVLLVYVTAVVLASGLVSGALAERTRFFASSIASVVLAGLVMPIAARWAWGGWLGRIGFIDVGGVAALHVTAGICAATGAYFVGPRAGKYNRDGSASMIPGHNIPLALAGTLCAIAGWIGYMSVIQSTLAIFAAANVLVAAAAAGAAAVVVGQIRYHKPDIGHVLVGLLGGLVAISAAGGTVGTPSAVLVGAVAGIIVPLASVWIDLRLRIDDPVGAVAIQVVGGAWGTLVTGLLLPLSAAERFNRLGVQCIGLLAIAALATAIFAALFAILRKFRRLRINETDEYDGLDLAAHDLAAYPDFQQNMIKSYHMREA